MHDIHPVAAVVKVGLGQPRHPEEVLVAEGHRWESHVVRPHHVDLGNGWEGEQVEDAVP